MNTSLIIRNLSDKVTAQDIKAIMNVISPIQSIKTLKNLQCVLIEFYDHKAAEQAFYMMNGRPIHNQIISIDWNYANTNIIVDPLDSSITESNLFKAFESLGAIDTCVMNESDHFYGIVTFSTKIDALQAMDQMNGKHLFSNPVHLTLQEESEEDDKSTIGSRRSSSSAQSDSAISGISYEDIFAQTPFYHTVIYIKNLPKQATRHEIISLLQHHGIVHNHEIIIKKRMAIITIDTHANATTAIFALQGFSLEGRPLRLGWWTREIQGNTKVTMDRSLANPVILDTPFMRPPAPSFIHEGVYGNKYY